MDMLRHVLNVIGSNRLALSHLFFSITSDNDNDNG